MSRVPSAVLRNKGVPVEVAVVDDGKRLLAEDEGVRTAQTWVRFDANALADLEEIYGSLEKFDEQVRARPTSSIRQALAIVWNVPPRIAGLMMLDGRQDDYGTAIAVALALANGVDPQQASDLLEEGVKVVSEARKQRTEAVKQMVAAERETGESPGTNGSAAGSVSVVPSTSSGA